MVFREDYLKGTLSPPTFEVMYGRNRMLYDITLPVNPWQNNPRMHGVSVGPWDLWCIVVYQGAKQSDLP